MPGEEPSSSTSSYDVPSSSYQTPARQQREYESKLVDSLMNIISSFCNKVSKTTQDMGDE